MDMAERTVAGLRRVLVDSDWRFARIAVIGLCVAVGLAIGAYVAILSPLYAVVLTLALIAAWLVLRDTQWGLVALIAVVCLLPFGALPFKIGFTPTFLDLALLAVFFVWIARVAAGTSGRFVGTALGMPVIVFIMLACASFLAGLAHASLDQYVVRHFAEIVLSIALFFAVTNCVRSEGQLKFLIKATILAGFTASLIGVVLYILPEAWSIRLLSSLGRVGYPTGSGVLRYIEDNPDLAQRAISTSTDPNVLGGLLILITTLTTAQLFSAKPLMRRAILGTMVLVEALCLYLTYSRGSMLGLAVGLGFLALVKYRKLIPVILVGGALLLLLPQTQAYVQRFLEGLRIEDLATQMRLGEYKDALTLIRRHPWIGVGFAGTPESSLYIGVSMVYLLIAEEMGLIGLGAFLLVISLFFAQVKRAWPQVRQQADLEAILLGLTASVSGILVGGLLDHYFFNLSFPHSVAVFWLYLGLAATTVKLGIREDGSPYLAVKGGQLEEPR